MQLNIVLLNFVYAIIGGAITLIFMFIGFRFLDRLTPFSTSDELAKDNRAVGAVVCGIFIGIGIAIGLVIGMGLN
ncbi:DUF350 domain-containing protein [candidate division KSB1 bacterium]|nr:DUF350 domain-containing protein [candidate division KSB1 bacterium]